MASTIATLPCVTPALLTFNAEQRPELVLLKFDSGESYTSIQLLAAVREYAAGLQTLGVRQDDYVLSWLPNGPLAVLLWLALNELGAIYVPINTAYKGRLLQHVIKNSGATLMIADGRLLERLHDIDSSALKLVVVAGAERASLRGITLLDERLLHGSAATLQPPPRALQAWDTSCVIFTSGTTGPSKGVLCSYRHTFTAACEFKHVGPGDTNLVALPMFHIGGILGVNFALIHGGTAAFVERFRTDTFWDTVNRLGVTSVGLLGTMVQFLMQQPVRAGEREHPVRNAVIAPFTDDALAFGARFGIDVHTEFNMTELSVPLWAGPNPTARGTCGKPRNGVQLKLVDAHDNEVGVGTIGELMLRCDEPWTLSHGYLNDAVATANAWRNQWFHTGDLFRRDADDNYYFVDRAKDMIRRRGENISSYEVEAELLAFPGVKAAAAVAVPGDGGEDDVLAVLAPQPGATLDPAALLDFLAPRMAHFMLPRYVRIIDELPLTPTQKIEKHVLRAQGITADTWDRGPRKWGQRKWGQSPFQLLRPEPGSASDKSVLTKQMGSDPILKAGPLAGVRVLEFAGLGPAPFCAMLLSDMGAEVTCIDRPGAHYSPADTEARGRTRVQLDLKTRDGKLAALKLLQQADILLEGFRPGVMERLGLGPKLALELNPRLVYGRMTGWGQHGPLSHKAGHDLNYLALTGALHALGTADQPAVPLNLIADFGGGALYLALGVLAAQRQAERTGKGLVVDAAMTDGVLSLLTMIYGDFADGRWLDLRASNVIDGAAPFYNVYRCGDGKFVSVAAIEPQFFRNLIGVLGLDAAWIEQQWDRAQWPQQKRQLADLFATRPRDEWSALFADVDACVVPVLSLAEAREHPHNVARRAFVERDGILQPAPAPRFQPPGTEAD
ncbi:MAG TPA: CoA transferase [Candidatus Acidoferrum sp.]|nr:CoA transferase [Candidatus Acidoferrum sp.]